VSHATVGTALRGALLVAGTELSDAAIALLCGAGILTVVTLSIIGGAVAATRSR